ncbi:AraC family transcriptional regulator [Ktedonobacter racemifer]|uniref:Transcriptional regulator, AraC family n=1 Tax=Ktedonobacter racemifer DSM 44963 TaxID=485913 RepID=D6TSK3_KTERA|nr:AraC family transcriptional regulator [Ktedonobacter racemifer]EFH83404.1 transcriptional regulator, AraC family [Ktedonobacter racemifer DSM 44963]
MEQVPLEGDRHNTVFDVPPEHIVQSSSGKGWDGLDVAEVIHPLDDFALPALPRHILVINLSTPSTIQERLAGRQGQLGTGNLVILPAGAPTNWHLEREGEVRHLHLYLSPTFIQEIATSADIYPDTVEFVGTLGIFDPQIESIALSLFSELRSDGLGGKLYVESLANILGIHLLRHHSSVKQPSLPRSVGLDKVTLRRVSMYIEEHLAEGLSLSEIAAVASLSPYHFTRLFKASTSFSPHQYVIQRRIERAKLLLSTTNWSLTTIAHAVGFANESHLALHFKRLTGLLPSSYR